MRALALSVVLSGLNQVVSSGTNFLVSALLARTLTAEGFGGYALAFSLLLLTLNVADALVMTPASVRLAGEAGRPDSSVPAALVLRSCAACAAALGLLSGVLSVVSFPGSGAGNLATPLAVASAGCGFVWKEAVVRTAFALRRERSALVTNLVFATLAVGLTWGGAPKGVVGAVLTYAVAAVLAGICGGILLCGRELLLHRASLSHIVEWMREGRWYLGSNLAYWCRLQAPVLAATWGLGLAAVGSLNAARLMIAPVVMFNPAIGQIALPRLARAAVAPGGAGAVARGAAAVAATLVCASAVYSGMVLLWTDRIRALLVGDRIAVERSLIYAWCAFTLIQALRNGLEVGLKASRRPRAVLTANLVAAIAVVPLLIAGNLWGHAAGLVWGAALAECVVASTMVILWRLEDGRKLPVVQLGS